MRLTELGSGAGAAPTNDAKHVLLLTQKPQSFAPPQQIATKSVGHQKSQHGRIGEVHWPICLSQQLSRLSESLTPVLCCSSKEQLCGMEGGEGGESFFGGEPE